MSWRSRILTLSLLINSLVSSAGTVSPCDCPPDKIRPVKTSCPNMPMPNELKAQLAKEPFYPPPETDCHIDPTNSTTKILAESPSTTVTPKNKFEVLNYLSCYRQRAIDNHNTATENFCNFKDHLAPYIDFASQKSGFPFSVEACLMMRESSMSPWAKSTFSVKLEKTNPKTKKVTTVIKEEHAYGYHQVTEGTYDQINTILAISYEDFTKTFNRLTKKLTEAKRKKRKKDIAYLKARIFNTLTYFKAKRVWDAYWGNTKPVPTGPFGSKADTGACPQIAMILSMMKQILDLSLLAIDQRPFNKETFKDLAHYQPGNAEPMLKKMGLGDTSVLLAGAYNSGAGSFADVCARTKTLNSCINAFKKAILPHCKKRAIDTFNSDYANQTFTNDEKEKLIAKLTNDEVNHNQTLNQMIGVRNCSQQHSEKQVSEVFEPSQNRNCKGTACYR